MDDWERNRWCVAQVPIRGERQSSIRGCSQPPVSHMEITNLITNMISIKCSPGFRSHCVEAKSSECKCACTGLNHGSKIVIKCSKGVEGSCQHAVYGECNCACGGFNHGSKVLKKLAVVWSTPEE